MKKIIGQVLCALVAIPAPAQTLQWLATMGGSGTEQVLAIATDPMGQVYATGSFTGTADMDPGPGVTNLTSNGNADLFVQKFDASGNLVYAHGFGGFAVETGYSVATDAIGNAYVTGFFQSPTDFDPGPGTFTLTPVGGLDGFLLKLDPAGELLWALDIGDTGFENGTAVLVDATGNIHLTGYFFDTVDFDPGPSTANLTSVGSNDVFVLKLDPNGAFQWVVRMGGSGADIARAACLDAAGNVYTTGTFNGSGDFAPGAPVAILVSAGSTDVFVSALDASGTHVWAKAFGGPGSDGGNSIKVDGDGNVLTTGYFNGTADFAPGTAVASLTSAGGADIFINKLDALGDHVWARAIGASADDTGTGIALDPADNVLCSGAFAGAPDFDPGPGTTILTANAGTDAFILQLDPAGDLMTAVGFGGSGGDAAVSLSTGTNGDLFVGGLFEGAVDFDPGPGNATSTAVGGSDAFILRFGDTSVGIAERSDALYALYPNPAIDRVMIQGLSGPNSIPYAVCDMFGRTCVQGSLSTAMPSLDIAALPSGTYALRLGSAIVRSLRLVKR